MCARSNKTLKKLPRSREVLACSAFACSASITRDNSAQLRPPRGTGTVIYSYMQRPIAVLR